MKKDEDKDDSFDLPADPPVPFPKGLVITELRRRLIRAVIENPEATYQELAGIIGVSGRNKVINLLNKPQVANILYDLLDRNGAQLSDSAKVIGEAHTANHVKIFQHRGQIIKDDTSADFPVRLQASELNFKLRGKLKDAGVTLNVFDSMTDTQIAQIASGQKQVNDFIDVTPGGGA